MMKEGKTVLSIALQYGTVEIVRMLLAHGAK
jgi:ankyrin repeat protein